MALINVVLSCEEVLTPTELTLEEQVYPEIALSKVEFNE